MERGHVMNRRDFLRNAAIIAGGFIAADQLELLERLAPRRLYFNGADFGQWELHQHYGPGRPLSMEMIREATLRIWETPFKPQVHVLGKNELRYWEVALR